MISSGFGRVPDGVRSPESLHWYACYTRGRHEKKVASNLESRGIEIALPLHRVEVRWSDRWKTVERPLFPSYVFARFAASELPQVLNTRGLVTILRSGGAPAAIPDEEIENVRRFAAAVSDHRVTPEREAVIEAGDRVRVLTGPFAGIEGVALLRRGRRRLLVALAPVGEGLAVDLDDASLQVIAPGGVSAAGQGMVPHPEAAVSPAASRSGRLLGGAA